MKKQGAKDRILETAGKLFCKHGYQAVGINEIIEKSGTAKATFYNHFPSKEKLCVAWLSKVHKQSEVRHEQYLKEADKPLNAVKQYFNDLKAWMLDTDFRGCPFTNTATVVCEDCRDVCKEICDHKAFHRGFFVDLARLFTKGSKATKLGNTLFVLYSGATTEAQNLKTIWPIETAADAAVALCKQATA